MNTTEYALLECLRYIKNSKPGEKKAPPHCDAQLLHKLMRKQGVELVLDHFVQMPRDIRIINQLEREAHEKAYATMYASVSPVFDRLKKDGVPYAVTKGLFLAAKVYPRVGDRKFGDIDILIDEMNLPSLVDALHLEGFRQGRFDKEKRVIKPIDRHEELFFLTYSHQTATFRKVVEGLYMHYMNVDINRHILWGECKDRYSAISIKDFLSHSRPFSFAGTSFPVLSDEFGFIHIALHLYNDLNSLSILHTDKSYNLRGFTDIYLMVRNLPLNWKKIQFYCRVNELEQYVYFVLSLTAQVFEDGTLLTLMEKPAIYNDTFEHTFGLSDDERKQWNHSLWERIFCPNKKDMLSCYLTDRDMQKITYNSRFV
jgi:hypothetical protein